MQDPQQRPVAGNDVGGHDVFANTPTLTAAVHRDQATQRTGNTYCMRGTRHAACDYLTHEGGHPQTRARLNDAVGVNNEITERTTDAYHNTTKTGIII
ncbi:hypothetical protein ASE69_16375 [Sphingomonas sp. Leaf208]|nr:hypothetical protein ASE69_16375 [Sphingomonas sp. Leaf208]